MTIYLYIKQCTHCQLKYFGYTKKMNPYEYPGSGKIWKRHIRKHKVNPITLEVFKFQDQKEATAFSLRFSEYNCIVESPLWANLMAENAITGANSEFMSRIQKGKKRGKYKPETKPRPPKIISEETIRKLKITMTGKKRGPYKPETKPRPATICDICNRSIINHAYKRHYNNHF